MSTRAAILVTGTEVLTGRVTDRNGPWLAEQLRGVGVDVAQVTVVGDRPEDLRAALHQLSAYDLVVTSGGLGPTEDDLTVAVVAEHQNLALEIDRGLEERIAAISRELSRRRSWTVDEAAMAAATAKQALVPVGATVLEPVGTAPGLVVPGSPPVVVLPGPPSELQRMWPQALGDPAVAAVLDGGRRREQRTLRIWGPPEAALAASLRDAGDLSGLELTTCVRTGELEVVGQFDPAAAGRWEALRNHLVAEFGDAVFSPDGETVDEQIARRLGAAGERVATAESCTGGLLSARLTEAPGASVWMTGGVVSYANEVKTDQVGVPAELIETYGAVSEPVARAMAQGVRDRLGTTYGVGITGIAGPGGGSAEKPVGLVHLAVAAPDGTVHERVLGSGGRGDVRAWAVQRAMHLLRAVLR